MFLLRSICYNAVVDLNKVHGIVTDILPTEMPNILIINIRLVHNVHVPVEIWLNTECEIKVHVSVNDFEISFNISDVNYLYLGIKNGYY